MEAVFAASEVRTSGRPCLPGEPTARETVTHRRGVAGREAAEPENASNRTHSGLLGFAPNLVSREDPRETTTTTRIDSRNQPGSVVRSGFFAKVLYVGDSCCHLKGSLGGHVVVTYPNISERQRRALLIPANLQGVEWSEWRDSNPRPLVPQTSALTGLRYTPTALLIGAVAAPRNAALPRGTSRRRRARLRKDSLRLHNFGQRFA